MSRLFCSLSIIRFLSFWYFHRNISDDKRIFEGLKLGCIFLWQQLPLEAALQRIDIKTRFYLAFDPVTASKKGIMWGQIFVILQSQNQGVPKCKILPSFEKSFNHMHWGLICRGIKVMMSEGSVCPHFLPIATLGWVPNHLDYLGRANLVAVHKSRGV